MGSNGQVMVMTFGMSRVHVFDNEVHEFEAIPYDFAESATQTQQQVMPR